MAKRSLSSKKKADQNADKSAGLLQRFKIPKPRFSRKQIRPAHKLPSLIGLTRSTLTILLANRALFLRLFLVVSFLALFLFGIAQQDQYAATSDAIKAYREEGVDKDFGAEAQFGLLLTTAALGGLNTTLSETQKVYLVLFYIFVGLTTVWLLRHRMAQVDVTVRDGFYNAGAPIVTIILLALVAMIQLLPMALGIIVYTAATTSGLLNGWIETLLFAMFTLVLIVVSLFWVTATSIAILIATNPGTYPIAALKTARKVVSGQRIRIMTHILWLGVLVVIAWAVVLFPAVLLDSWISQKFLPIVVLSVQVLTSFTIIFATSYVYVLYRRLIDEPAK